MIVLPDNTSSFGLTLAEMKEEVADQIDNDKIPTKITRWLNITITTLAARFTFHFLHSSGEIVTQANQRNYVLNSDFMWLKNMWIPSKERDLQPIGEKDLLMDDPDANEETGEVWRYILNHRSVDLWHVPDSSFSIPYTYQRRPVKLVADSDVSDFPYEWHEAIVQGAIVRGFRYGNDSQYPAAYAEYREMIRDLRPTIYKRPDYRHVFRTPTEDSGRPARPSMPSGFPRIW